jgi:hypothetical protein
MCLPILQLSYRLFFGKTSHHPGLSAPIEPKFVSLRLLTVLQAKIAVESDICECDGHAVHKLNQRRLTADWLAHGRVTVHGCAVRSPLTGYQVTSRWFSRYSKWLVTFPTGLVFIQNFPIVFFMTNFQTTLSRTHVLLIVYFLKSLTILILRILCCKVALSFISLSGNIQWSLQIMPLPPFPRYFLPL